MNSRSFILVFVATLALAAKPNPNVPVTTYSRDSTASGTAYYIQRDGQTGPQRGERIVPEAFQGHRPISVTNDSLITIISA